MTIFQKIPQSLLPPNPSAFSQFIYHLVSPREENHQGPHSWSWYLLRLQDKSWRYGHKGNTQASLLTFVFQVHKSGAGWSCQPPRTLCSLPFPPCPTVSGFRDCAHYSSIPEMPSFPLLHFHSTPASWIFAYLKTSHEPLGWPQGYSGFSWTSFRNIQMNFLATAILILSLCKYLNIEHSIVCNC